jgi:hypothetical protein
MIFFSGQEIKINIHNGISATPPDNAACDGKCANMNSELS